MALEPEEVPSRCFLLDVEKLLANLKILKAVKDEAQCNIILALKAFSFWPIFPLIAEYLDGVSATSRDEALMGRRRFGKKVHTYSPAYEPHLFAETALNSDYLIFNSAHQLNGFRRSLERIETESGHKPLLGLRINHCHSEVKDPMWDPANPRCGLGMIRSEFKDIREKLPENVTGLHFHSLFENGSDALERTLRVFEDDFGDLIKQSKWTNWGGGHLITSPEYETNHLISLISAFKRKYGVSVILEPGCAVVYQAGYLSTTVLEVSHGNVASVDVSAENHIQDVLHGYEPKIEGATRVRFDDDVPHKYIIRGVTCAAGDFLGCYSFPEPLKPGYKLLISDMAHYTMVKTSHFNGAPHPSYGVYDRTSGEIIVVREFGYNDFESRMG